MRVVFLAGAGVIALALGACGAGESATSKAPANPPASISAAGQTSQSVPAGQAAAVDPRYAPAPLATDGKPIWAANRNHTAVENADYQFGKNGKDFAAANEADYVAKVHAFVDKPPTGVQKVARSNGDALLYDAKTNTFAVVSKTGAPRTMFKPRDGASYWQQQVSRQQSRSNGEDKSDSQSG